MQNVTHQTEKEIKTLNNCYFKDIYLLFYTYSIHNHIVKFCSAVFNSKWFKQEVSYLKSHTLSVSKNNEMNLQPVIGNLIIY